MRSSMLILTCALLGCSSAALKEGNPRSQRKERPMRTVTLDQSTVGAIISEHMVGFETCQSRGAGHFVSGAAIVQFSIGGDQRVERVHVIDSSLGSWAIEQCLLQAARFLTFPLPKDADRGEFRYPFSFNEVAERITVPKPESWGYASLGAQRAGFNGCRSRYGFDGPFHITAYISSTGRPRSVGFHSRKPAPDDFASCVVNVTGEAKFPSTRGAIVKYRGLVEYLGGN